MVTKIDALNALTAHHVVDGPVTFPYAVDAQSAVGRHPLEWSFEPWSAEDAEVGLRHVMERYERERDEAEQAARHVEARRHGVALPRRPRIDEPVDLTPEEQAALDEHAKAVAEANERLAKFRAEQEEKRKAAEQVAADEALVKSAPPLPDPNRPRRPFGRPGEPTPAEIAAQKKRDAKKAEDERIVREKAEQDRLANSNATVTT